MKRLTVLVSALFLSACSMSGGKFKWDYNPQSGISKENRHSPESIAEIYGYGLEEGQCLTPFRAKGLVFEVCKKTTTVGDGENVYRLPRLVTDIHEAGKPFPLVRIKNADPYAGLNPEYDVSISEGKEADSVMVCDAEKVCRTIEVDGNVLNLRDTGLEGTFYRDNDLEYAAPDNLKASFRNLTNFQKD